MSEKDRDLDMKERNRETKAGSHPAANVSMDPERGYGTTKEKEMIKEKSKQ